jgi:hypothetical protein
VATTFYRRTVVLAQTMRESADDRATPPGVEICDLGAQQIADYLRLRPDQTEGEVCARLARGDRCRTIRTGDSLVHAGWLARGFADVAYLEALLVLDPEDLYSYDSFTAPGWRGRGLAPARHLDLLCGGAGTGARRVLVVVALENWSGLRVFAKLGYRTIGGYTLARLGRWRRWWVESAGDDRIPELRPWRRGEGDGGQRHAPAFSPEGES